MESKEDDHAEHSGRCSTPILEESVLNDTLEMENTTLSPMYGKGKRKLIRDKSNVKTLGGNKEARPTTEDNPNIITVVDRNSNTDSI